MIQLVKGIWIGDSADEAVADLSAPGITAILNVAQDLQCTRGWLHEVEYAQVGLIDGPGNEVGAYSAAVITLDYLTKRHKNVLVCCHTGGRALAVTIMYINMVSGCWRGWVDWIALLTERIDDTLPMVNNIHVIAFSKLNWDAMVKIAGVKQ